MSLNLEVRDAAKAADVHYIRTLAILSVLMAFASISTDLYLPALPVMVTALKTSPARLDLTISTYLIGFSLGQLAWGPIADRYGRRRPIAAGLLCFVLGSAGCAVAVSAEMLIAFRILQAVGACASVVLSRAIVRDIYQGRRAAQVMSTLMTVMAIAPLVGPSVGGVILQLASWRAIFWALVAIGMATLGALYYLPETLPDARRSRTPIAKSLRVYGELIVHRPLIGCVAVVAFYYGGTYAYIAGSPFAYIGYYHISPHLYAMLFGVGIVGIMLVNQINARLLRHYPGEVLVRIGCVFAAVMGVILALDARFESAGLWGLVAPIFFYVSAAGFVAANSMAAALEHFPNKAGAASALMGSLQYGMGILGSAAVGFFNDNTPRPMAYVIAIMSIAGLLSAIYLMPRTQHADAG